MSTRRRQQIGVLGGTFNPVHLGHLLIAQAALEQGKLDLVKFIPSAKPPHKRAKQMASARQRLHMLRLAIDDDPRMEVDDLEIRRGGISYSIDTLHALRHCDSSASYTFIIGSDSLADLHQWREITQLATLCRFLAVSRPGVNAVPPRSGLGIRYRVVSGHPVGISSREIRRRCSRGQTIRYLVPRTVSRYIERQRLYQ